MLSTGDWAVLGLVGEGPTHGFAVARLLAVDGAIGRVWALRRPLVYRSLERLQAAGLVAVQATESGERGPERTVLAVTAAGATARATWLVEPVHHIRDLRSLLLLKLALADRAGLDPAPLLDAQRQLLVPQVDALRAWRDGADGFDRVLATWRLESSAAALRFIDEVRSTAARTPP